MEKVIRFLTLFLVAIATLVFIYYGYVKFDKCEKELYTEISNKFAQEAIHWRDSIIEAKNLTSWGNYNSQGYKDKKVNPFSNTVPTLASGSLLSLSGLISMFCPHPVTNKKNIIKITKAL